MLVGRGYNDIGPKSLICVEACEDVVRECLILWVRGPHQAGGDRREHDRSRDGCTMVRQGQGGTREGAASVRSRWWRQSDGQCHVT